METWDAYVPLMIGIGTFLAASLLFAGLVQYYRHFARERELLKKLRESGEERASQERDKEAARAAAKGKSFFLNLFGVLGSRVAPSERSSDYSRLRTRLIRAGFRTVNAPVVFWGIRCMLALGLAVGFFMLRTTVFNIVSPTVTLEVCVLLATAGFYAPEIWLAWRISKRKEALSRALPDALDLLVVCVEAGMGLDAAINRIAEEIRMSHPVLSDELKLFNLELRAGKPRHDALNNLAERIDLEDMKSFVTLLIQTDRFGTSLSQALRTYSDTFRTRRRTRAEEIAAKLPARLMFPLILLIFPSLFVVILGPAAIRIYQFFLNR